MILGMKNLILPILALLISYSIKSQKIYSSNKSYQADLKVFVVQHEYQADLKVFKVNQSYQAEGNSGLWHFVTQEYLSNKKIFFVDYEYQADLKIFFVNYNYQSGWRNSNKKHLLY